MATSNKSKPAKSTSAKEESVKKSAAKSPAKKVSKPAAKPFPASSTMTPTGKWLLKSEPGTYSIHDLKRDGTTTWDGIRNYEARNNLRKMSPGDVAYIYHSGEDKAIVGVAKIKSAAMDEKGTDGEWSVVELSYDKTSAKPLTLASIKANKELANMQFVRRSRLSVSIVTKAEWDAIAALTR